MAERKIIWTADAEDDFNSIIERIENKSISKANHWGELLLEKLELLKQFPEMGRIVPEKQLSFFREIRIEEYRLFYTYLVGIIYLVGFLHESQDLKKM